MSAEESGTHQTGPNWLEVGAVIGTAVLHLLFLEVIGDHLLFIIAANAGWGRLRDWGFGRAGGRTCRNRVAGLPSFFVQQALDAGKLPTKTRRSSTC